MPIGYANFGDIQQGNQQVVNSMAGLGQSISSAIETQAATQSAQAMLPMLQQQYASGIQKIAAGEEGGMADVIQAASLASQNPITAGIGKNMISGMNQVSQMARTQAYLQGTRLSSMGAHPEMYNPDGTFNTSRLGQYAPQKPMTAYQQVQSDKSLLDIKNDQINEYGALYSGDPSKNVEGIGTYASKINEAISEGKAPESTDLQNFAGLYNIYKQKQSNYGKYAVTNPQIDNAFQMIQKEIPELTNIVKKESSKGKGFMGIQALGGTDPNKVKSLNEGIEQIRSLNQGSRLPAVNDSQQQDQNPQIQQGNATFSSPDQVKAAFQAGQINQDQAVQLLQSF
jgi:hypothetical protein